MLAEFERLAWAGVIDSRHDTGTDLRLRPQDARRYEIGAVMGAQVKTGWSHFASSQRDAGGVITGWRFAESDLEHFDCWLNHALPHAVILRDQQRNTSFCGSRDCRTRHLNRKGRDDSCAGDTNG